MRKTSFFRRGFFLVAAASLALVTSGLPVAHAASHSANRDLLTDQLPLGVTLASSKPKQLMAAVRAAAQKRPDDAADIVHIAIMAKKPKRGGTPCSMVHDIVAAAMKGAPGKSRDIAEMAQSTSPDCADTINQALNTSLSIGGRPVEGAVPGGTTGEAGTAAAGDASGLGAGDFGAGFGPGSPGSPGFGGSSPSGGFALPTPVPPAVTSSVNT